MNRITLLVLLFAAAAANASSQPEWKDLPAHLEKDGWTFEAQTADPGFLFTARDPGGSVTTFPVGQKIDAIHDVVIRPRTLIVIGNASVATTVSVLSIPDRSVKDRFIARHLVPSPSGRYLAFTRFYPMNHPVGADIYLVYDSDRTAGENRMPPARLSGDALDEDIGWAVYPELSRTKRSYDEFLYTEDSRHLCSSPKWIGDRYFAFVDRGESETNVVLVDVSNGIRRPRIQKRRVEPSLIVDVTKVPDDARPLSFFAYSSTFDVERVGTRISVTLQYQPRNFFMTRSFTVDFDSARH